MRNIEVDGKSYKWKVGRAYVLIRGDDYRAVPSLPEATNGYFVDRDFEKRNAFITPAMIAEYIRKTR